MVNAEPTRSGVSPQQCREPYGNQQMQPELARYIRPIVGGLSCSTEEFIIRYSRRSIRRAGSGPFRWTGDGNAWVRRIRGLWLLHSRSGPSTNSSSLYLTSKLHRSIVHTMHHDPESDRHRHQLLWNLCTIRSLFRHRQRSRRHAMESELEKKKAHSLLTMAVCTGILVTSLAMLVLR